MATTWRAEMPTASGGAETRRGREGMASGHCQVTAHPLTAEAKFAQHRNGIAR